MNYIIYTDFACPFCYIGHKMLQRLEQETGTHFTYRFKQIHPDVPDQGADSRYLFSGQRIDAMNTDLMEKGKEYGIRPAVGKTLYNTRLATLLFYYLEQHEPESVPHYIDAVYQAHFTDEEDISSAALLEKVLKTTGLDPQLAETARKDPNAMDALRQAVREAFIEGADIVPTFVVGKKKFKGLCSYEDLRDAVKEEIPK